MRVNDMIFSTLSLVLAVMVHGGQGLPPQDYTVNFGFDRTEVHPEEQISISYTPALISLSQNSYRNLSIFLLQSNIPDGQVDASNTVKLLDIQSNICIYRNSPVECGKTPFESIWPVKSAAVAIANATFSFVDKSSTSDVENLFFCFAVNNATGEYCRYYSSVFKILPSLDIDQPTTDSIFPTAKPTISGPHTSQGLRLLKYKRDLQMPPFGDYMPVFQKPDFIPIELSGTATSQNSPTVQPTFFSSTTWLAPSTTHSEATLTIPEITVATVTSQPTVVTTEVQKGGGSGGLSTAAKVGIALGALAFALILLILALLFLRRKHAKRNQPEQVMLTHSMNTDSFSQNLITEKEDPTTAAAASVAATPIDEPAIPVQRHSSLATYEPVPSAPPYTGVTAAAAAAAIPRRKPTAATMASTVSRGLSTTSGTSSSGARSPRSGEGFEQYHDVPIYGDARHSPQVFPGTTRSMQSPFLSEEGMTPEEIARLEEEERRIDAAIAEAERR